MLDLYELERLFNNWLKARGGFKCELFPRFVTKEHYKIIFVDVCKITQNNTKVLLETISASGQNPENIWDKIYDKLFAYFMEIGKHVE